MYTLHIFLPTVPTYIAICKTSKFGAHNINIDAEQKMLVTGKVENIGFLHIDVGLSL